MTHTGADGTPWTFRLDSTGDIDWVPEHQTVGTVGGPVATVQDLKVALDTIRRNRARGVEGEDPRDPKFGLDVFEAMQSAQSLQREVRRTLEYDDYRHERVSAIRAISVEQYAGREMAVEATISLRDEPQDITLSINLATGDLSVYGVNQL